MYNKFQQIKFRNGPWKYWIKQSEHGKFAHEYVFMNSDEAKAENYYFKIDSKRQLGYEISVGWCERSNRFRIYNRHKHLKNLKYIPRARIKNGW